MVLHAKNNLAASNLLFLQKYQSSILYCRKYKENVENIGKENKLKITFTLNYDLLILKMQSRMLVTVYLFPLTACKPVTQIKSYSQTSLQTVAEKKACFVGCYHSGSRIHPQRETEGASQFYIVWVSWIVKTGLISVFAHQRNGPEAVESMLA